MIWIRGMDTVSAVLIFSFTKFLCIESSFSKNIYFYLVKKSEHATTFDHPGITKGVLSKAAMGYRGSMDAPMGITNLSVGPALGP